MIYFIKILFRNNKIGNEGVKSLSLGFTHFNNLEEFTLGLG
jgi:hypothetical protein